MNKRQKELLQVQLDNEKAVLKKLKENYADALAEINSKIELLMARQDADMQHVIYQVEYQKAMKKQVQAILETLQNNEFETISEYLTKSYDDGFVGAMYELQGSGIPLVFPIDQEAVVAAIQHETKLSEDLYTSLGRDVTDLRKKIAGEISRGISTGMMSTEIARNISSWARIPMNNAMRIARTESHRIQNKAISDAQFKAKDKGADVVKIWSAALDGRTRTSHRKLDGQIRELEEPFEVDGRKVMYPGGFGRPEEDCNCRCRCNSKARWLLGEAYTKWSEDAPVVIDDDGTAQLTIIDADNYKDFHEKYIKAAEQVRSNAQKISEKKKTAEGVFDTFNNTKADSIRPRSIIKNMKKSEVGTEALVYLEENNVPVRLCYGVDNPKGHLGIYDPFEDEIMVFCDKTKTIEETAATVIHEAKHRMLGATNTKAEEIECYKYELLHLKGELTQNDIDAIIEHVNKYYPHLE